MPSSKPLKIKPSEVAADTKRKLIPEVTKHYRNKWPPYSYLYPQPLVDLPLPRGPHMHPDLPKFRTYNPSPSWKLLDNVVLTTDMDVYSGDPVNIAISWAESLGAAVPFICSANEKRPGGDWETGVVGYEERLCRRSNLSATLSTPDPATYVDSNYPIPIEGAIYSPHVVRFRHDQDRIESLDVKDWQSLPVVSMPPTRWPKLTDGGRKYSFAEERQLVMNKMRAALRICAYQQFRYVVVGDFGLGNGYRNPPRELAELWREVLLWDTDLRGQFLAVVFVFEDEKQSTVKHILDDIAKKNKGGSSSSSSSKSRSKSGSSSSGSSSSGSSGQKSDFRVFSEVFNDTEVARVRNQIDPRYGFATIMGGA
ncbi:hypothetical protein VDGD_09940 [Verticillium dahliae]|nr:hypothetical protein VD0001_g5805 [Verticillium dahliae]RBQ65236.1 hypothetical protein VDGD_09940 [Verticillium dahliae]